jgi:hypothetical protein
MGAGMKSGRTRSLTLTGWATLLIFASCGCAQRAAPEANAPESSAAAPTIAPSTAPRVCTRWTPDWRDKCDELEPSATIATATANSTEPPARDIGPEPRTGPAAFPRRPDDHEPTRSDPYASW